MNAANYPGVTSVCGSLLSACSTQKFANPFYRFSSLAIVFCFGWLLLTAPVSFAQSSPFTAVGQWPGIEGGYVKGIGVSGQYAYVLESQHLRIYDISDPSAPGNVTYAGMATNLSLQAIQPSGKNLFCLESGGLRVLDISDPFNPVQIANFTMPNGTLREFRIVGNRALLMMDSGLRVFDISSPANILSAGIYNIATTSGGVDAQDHYVYMADRINGLQIIDLSNPSNLVRVGQLATLGEAVRVQGNYAYVAAGNSGLQIVDVSNPASPMLVGTFNSGGFAEKVDVEGGIVALSCGANGLQFISVKTPAGPQLISVWSGNVADALIVGKRAHIISREKILGDTTGFSAMYYRIINLVNSAAPFLEGEADSYFYGPTVEGFAKYQRWLYVPVANAFNYFNGTTQPIEKVDIFEFAARNLVKKHRPIAGLTNVVGSTAANGYAFFSTHSNEFKVYDLQNPISPKLIATLPNAADGAVVVNGVFAYAVSGNQLSIIDIGTPSNPVLRAKGSYLVYRVDSLQYANGRVYSNYIDSEAYSTSYGVQAFDVNSPANPINLGQFPDAHPFKAVGNTAYTGSQIVDVSNFSNRLLIRNYNPYGLADFEILGNYLAGRLNSSVLLNISDLSKPDLVEYDEYPGALTAGGKLHWDGNQIYAVGKNLNNGIRIVQVSAPIPVSPPVIQQQPANTTVLEQGSVSLIVKVSEDEPTTYQWFKDGTALTNSTRFQGVTSSRLVVCDATLAESGNYQVVVSNLATNTTSAVATLSVVPLTVTPQVNWATSFGSPNGDDPSRVAIDKEGNIFLLGHYRADLVASSTGLTVLTNASRADVFLIKLDCSGYPLWAVRTDADWGYGLAVDDAGSAYFTGRFDTSADFTGAGQILTGNQQMYVVKFDRNGGFQWVRQIGSPNVSNALSEGRAIAVQGTNVYVAGTYFVQTVVDTVSLNSPENSNNQGLLIKYDTDGNFQWVREIGGRAFETNNVVAVDLTGNVVVAGNYLGGDTLVGETTLPISVGPDIYAVKYSPDGEVLWATHLGSTGFDQVTCGGVDAAGNVYLAGSFTDSTAFQQVNLTSVGGTDIFLTKLNGANGQVIWAKSAGGNDSDDASDLVVDPVGNVYLAGTFHRTAYFGGEALTTFDDTSSDGYLAEFDAQGNKVWVRNVGGNTADYATALATDNRGHFALAGIYNERPKGSLGNLPDAHNGDVFLMRWIDAIPQAVPTFVSQPVNGSYVSGTSLTLLGAGAGTPPIGYQWFFNGTPLSGATSNRLSLVNLQPANAGQYTLVISNQFGQTTSTVAQVTVLVPPSFIGHPSSVTLPPGNGVVLSGLATGTAPISYQWQRNGTNLVGQTSSSLTLPTVGTNEVGQFTLVASNAAGTATSYPAELTVLDLNTFAGLVILGRPGSRYRIEYADRLGNTNNWSTLDGNFLLPSSPYVYVDLASPNASQRFYRATSVPPEESRALPDKLKVGRLVLGFVWPNSTFGRASSDESP